MKKGFFNKKYGLQTAVIERRKTQTRRICRNQVNPSIAEAKWKVGEEIAVAQSYNDTWQHTGYMTELEAKHCPGYNNAMFTKAALMPHRIKITYVRIEHLQDISDLDCFGEGIEMYVTDGGHKTYSYPGGGSFFTPKEAFSSLIDKTCGKGTWESNPWVFVYDFELVK